MEKGINNQIDLFDEMVDSVIILNKNGVIKEVNQATVRLLDYKNREDLLEKPIERICKDFSLTKIMEKIPLQNYETVYSNRWMEEVPVNVSITVRKNAPGATEGIILIARDISKTKGLIDELIKSREDLETSYAELQSNKDELIRTEKLAFTGRIAASVAHEVRNPLTNVSISLQQLKKSFKPGNPKSNNVELIMRNIERIEHLITELIDCARPPKLIIGPYDIHKVLKNVLELTKSKRGLQRIKVVKRFTPKQSIIKMDKEQLERAFSNLIINAIEAMRRGGILTIVTELNKNFFVVKVQDTGKGIPEKNVIRIFDPFFSSKPQGVGLGLTVCYGIIVSHGGTIEVESKWKKGSIFTVSLPSEQQPRERE